MNRHGYREWTYWKFSTKESVENAAECPDIDLLAVWDVLEHLWRYVMESAHSLSQHLLLAMHGNPEINDLQIIIIVFRLEEDVIQLARNIRNRMMKEGLLTP